MKSLLDAIINHPWVVLIVFLVGAGALGWQARHFEIDASADTLLTKNNRQYIQTQIINQRFAPQEFLIIAYQPANHPVFSEQTFEDLRVLTGKLQEMERVESARSILNVPLLSLASGDELSTQIDLSAWTLENRDFSIDELRKAFTGHPIYENLLINDKQTATAIQVLFRSDPALERITSRIVELQRRSLDGADELSDEERKELEDLRARADRIGQRLDETRVEEIRALRRMLAEHDADADFYLGGVHVLGYQLIQIIKNDLVVFGAAIAIVICIVLLLLFRTPRWVIVPVVCCAFSVVMTVGLFGLLGFKATVISSNFITLQLILTLAIVIHLIVQYREYATADPDRAQADLVRQTLQRKAAPCLYAGLTTAVGFAALLFSNIQPVVTFGWMMMIAIFVSIGVSLVLFPALLMLFGKYRTAERRQFSGAVLGFFTRLTLNHPVAVTIVSGVVLAASVAGLFRLDVENSFINYFRDSTRVHQELSFIDRQFGGSTPLDLVYTIAQRERKEDLVLTADTVQTLQRVQQALQQHEAVGKVLSVVNFTELARKLNDDKPLTEYEFTALYWTLDEALRSQLLGSFFAPEHAQVRFSMRIRDATPGLDRAELMAGIRNDLERLGIPEDRYMLTNLFVLYQDILQRLFQSQILTLGIVYVVLALAFVVVFRSLRIAMIGITPNVLTTLAVLGLMGWLGITLDLMTITIAAIAMGIAVDDTIHYIHRYREELHDGPGDQAVRRSHASVGHAILYTTLVIVLGFAMLGFSDFVPGVLFGLLTGFAMLMALIFDLTMLPVLLRRFAGKPAPTRE